MARLTRVSPIGVPQHIVQRGNNHQVCFERKKRGQVEAIKQKYVLYPNFRALQDMRLTKEIIKKCCIARLDPFFRFYFFRSLREGSPHSSYNCYDHATAKCGEKP